MKGIILAGGTGSRLYPLTKSISKQILPLYDKPIIYYPLSVLMLAGIKDILIISTERDIDCFKELFGNGDWLGMNFSYEIQKNPNGIAEAFIIGEEFIGSDNVALVLGDNIFYGQSFTKILNSAVKKIETEKGAVIFGYYVANPSSYGVVEFDENNKVINIKEKPENPKSNYVVPGLYFYDSSVIEIAKQLRPSARNELEITDINNLFLTQNKLSVELLGRGMAWLDTGTYDSLLDASNFIATIQKRQGLYVSCIEEISYRNGWISKEKLLKLATEYKTDYGKYLEYVAKN